MIRTARRKVEKVGRQARSLRHNQMPRPYEGPDRGHFSFVLKGVGTVQRPGDWTGFTWGDYDPSGDGTLRLRQSKTEKPLILPCIGTLKTTLDAATAALGQIPIASRPILCRVTGWRMSYRCMADAMLKERRRLGLEALDLHALRYREIKELAWAGCTDEETAGDGCRAPTAMI